VFVTFANYQLQLTLEEWVKRLTVDTIPVDTLLPRLRSAMAVDLGGWEMYRMIPSGCWEWQNRCYALSECLVNCIVLSPYHCTPARVASYLDDMLSEYTEVSVVIKSFSIRSRSKRLLRASCGRISLKLFSVLSDTHGGNSSCTGITIVAKLTGFSI